MGCAFEIVSGPESVSKQAILMIICLFYLHIKLFSSGVSAQTQFRRHNLFLNMMHDAGDFTNRNPEEAGGPPGVV